MLVRFEDLRGNFCYVDLEHGAMLVDDTLGRTTIHVGSGSVTVDENIDSVAMALGYTGSVAKEGK